MVDQNGGKFERFKTSKKDRILSKSNFSFAEVHWVRYRIRQENKNFDDMGTLNDKTLKAELTVHISATAVDLSDHE